MGAAELQRFDGQRALVVGGATGMGAAAAELLLELGAEVVVMDFAPVTTDGVRSISLDLRSRESIDAALDECGGPIHALLACAGVGDGVEGIERINFLGHRHLIERAIDLGFLLRGSAVAWISSAAGLAWEVHLEELQDYLATPDFESGVEWVHSRKYKADYMWSKQAACAYVSQKAVDFARRGLRINAIVPGPTDTPLARSNEDLWLSFGADYREDVGVGPSTPMEQAQPLVFLASRAASYVNGALLVTDAGYCASGITGSYPAATDPVKFLRGGFG